VANPLGERLTSASLTGGALGIGPGGLGIGQGGSDNPNDQTPESWGVDPSGRRLDDE
jgi:hypothetical protein